ncbi:ATP-binding protein [Methanoculleus chikugoensis]|uniref:histidine kinase n=1 Tax=Methanoculleus chikugoensis TaxID=118126 RepID=A0ABN5XJV0_9EURY|nr:ATP-binding protein [Methanoculleus chikugoensis]BBL68445.1 hypothetical protein MchiMG62_16260 [Methanoculleus chikugoensis]
MAGQRRFAGIASEDARLPLLAASVVIAFVANAAGLVAGITSVFPHLMYLPIVLAACWFPRRGIAFSLAIALGYLAMTLPFAGGDAGPVVAALARAMVFVAIGAVISLLILGLREREQRYRAVFDNSEAGAFILTPGDGEPRIEEVNYVGAALLGSRANDLVGEPIIRFLDDPAVWREFQAKVRRDGAVYGYEVPLRRPDGVAVRVLESGGLLPDGRIILTLVDITARTNAEDSLRRTNAKLNMLGRLTQNDLLAGISTLLGRIGDGVQQFDDPALLRYLGGLEQDALVVQRSAEITRDYQDLGLRPADWQPLQSAIREATSCLLLPELSVRSWVERVEVFADPMLDRVFLNLIKSSARHGKTVSQVVITYQVGDDGLLIYVEDDGVGIPETEKERIFEYGACAGGGLGLFLVREILSITNMTIREIGEPGTGARFEIHVPLEGYRII